MPSSTDQLVTLLTSIGPLGTGLALAAVPVVAGAAAYITRMGSQARIDSLESQVSRLETMKGDELDQAQRRYTELDERYQAILRSGALIHAQLEAVISESAEIAERLNATDYSVLVPAPTSIPGDAPDQLVFLCASGSQSSKLKWVRVPISTSLSGAVYLSGKATIASPTGEAFSDRTDKVADYKTNEALSVCLRYRNERIGVAQFLNKRSGRFDSEDTDRALTLCASLSVRVGDFMSDPRRIIEIGHTPRMNQYKVTIMVVDLTSYAKLFDRLDSSIITDLLNQFFQELCAIAIRHGATIDQFMGDGVLLIFNIDQNQNAHEAAAVAAALEMREAFRTLRQRWVTLGYAGTEMLFVRFGLSSGLVSRAEVGHSQARRITVIGPAVNAAAHTCEAAPRDHDTICVTEEFRRSLPGDVNLSARPVTTPKATFFEVSR